MMKYSSSRIQQEMRILNVRTLIEMSESGRLNFSPTFGSLPKLSKVNRSLIIESLILGLPLETIWAEQDALGKTQLLSGFDIISYIRAFAFGKFALHGLKVLKHLDGLRFEEIDYVEKRHFEQMELVFNSISYDSNPLLKYMLVKKINKEKYAANAAQLARNIIFPECSMKALEFATYCVSKHNNSDHSLRKKTNSTVLRMQTDILYGLLLVYMSNNLGKINLNIGLESYSYSRSHSLEYSNDLGINLSDDLDSAVTKLTMMLETGNRGVARVLSNLQQIICSIFDRKSVDIRTIGQNFRVKRTADDQFWQSLLDYIWFETTSKKSELHLSRSMSVQDLLERIDND
ncbi:TPA: hypothetical protein PXL76_002166 [Yersinia enterocolitica]|nr:hypothetical protein [Yersinia enterocolitica]HDL6890694.1 hypothetical protein [Yersinia enterocolitica]